MVCFTNQPPVGGGIGCFTNQSPLPVGGAGGGKPEEMSVPAEVTSSPLRLEVALPRQTGESEGVQGALISKGRVYAFMGTYTI